MGLIALRSARPVMICAPAAKRPTFRRVSGIGKGRERREPMALRQ